MRFPTAEERVNLNCYWWALRAMRGMPNVDQDDINRRLIELDPMRPLFKDYFPGPMRQLELPYPMGKH